MGRIAPSLLGPKRVLVPPATTVVPQEGSLAGLSSHTHRGYFMSTLIQSKCRRSPGKRSRFAGIRIAVATCWILCPSALSAQWAVYDAANYAESVLHYEHQLMQIKYQLQALAKLKGAPWRDIGGSIGDIGSVMGQRGALGYASPNVATTFQNFFPVARLVADWPREQMARAQSAVNVLQAALVSTARQQDPVDAGQATLERMKALNGSLDGHEQALELQNTAAVFNAQELMLLRQAAMAQTNIQAVYYANQLNAEAQRDGTVRDALDQLSKPPAPTADISLRVAP
jgi:P-type conjugative transfer protein TrbJ